MWSSARRRARAGRCVPLPLPLMDGWWVGGCDPRSDGWASAISCMVTTQAGKQAWQAGMAAAPPALSLSLCSLFRRRSSWASCAGGASPTSALSLCRHEGALPSGRRWLLGAGCGALAAVGALPCLPACLLALLQPEARVTPLADALPCLLLLPGETTCLPCCARCAPTWPAVPCWRAWWRRECWGVTRVRSLLLTACPGLNRRCCWLGG